MKKVLLFVGVVLLALGCTQEEKYPDEFNNDLPFGLKYYISEKSTGVIIDSLIEAGILELPYSGSSSYNYKLPLNEGSVKLSVTPRFYNDSLYYIDIREGSVLNGKKDKENYKNGISFFKAQEINLNASQKSFDKLSKSYNWNNDGRGITLMTDNSFIIVFKDGYINDRLNKASSAKILKGARDRIENGPDAEVMNSAWDGSVSQVKDYLKTTLKDPKSYEGIEWSDVQETDQGYKVRHKYRAKNSLGGYVVSNQIFTIDKKGKVIDVASLQ